MDNKMIKLPSYFTGFSSKNDGSASLRFATQELSAEDFKIFKDCLNGYGWLVFRPNDLKIEDIPMEDVEDKSKTPSKRQRACIFKIWKQNNIGGDFESYYRLRMEGNIDRLKQELE